MRRIWLLEPRHVPNDDAVVLEKLRRAGTRVRRRVRLRLRQEDESGDERSHLDRSAYLGGRA